MDFMGRKFQRFSKNINQKLIYYLDEYCWESLFFDIKFKISDYFYPLPPMNEGEETRKYLERLTPDQAVRYSGFLAEKWRMDAKLMDRTAISRSPKRVWSRTDKRSREVYKGEKVTAIFYAESLERKRQSEALERSTLAGKLVTVISFPWRKYSNFLDNGSRGIWGLSPVLKYTLLYFLLFFVPLIFGWVKLYEDNSTTSLFAGIYIIGLMFVAFIWLVYLPILLVILVYRFIKKARSVVKEGIKIGTKKDKKEIKYILVTNLGRIYYFFMAFLVQFFPFSYLYKDRLFHPSNQKLKSFIIQMEKIAKKVKVPILFYGSAVDGSMLQFNAVLEKPLKRNGLKKLETSLQGRLGTIYVRKEDKFKLRIFMPVEIMETYEL